MAVWEQFKTNKQWEVYLKQLLATNDMALLRATIVIYNNQTDEEKYHGECIEDNNVGFSKYDVGILSKLSLKILCKKQLSKKEMEILRVKIPKYWKQLMVIGKRKAQDKRQLEDEIRSELDALEQQRLEPQYIQMVLAQCSDESNPTICAYGICDECPKLKSKYQE